MVNEEIVVSTIKRMLEAEIDDNTIISTLKDIGMDDQKSREMVNSVKKNISNVSQENSSPKDSFQENSSKESSEEENVGSVEASPDSFSDNSGNDFSENIVKEDSDSSERIDEDSSELNDVTSQNILDMQERKIDEVDKKLEEFKNSVSASEKSVVIPKELLEKVSDISSQNNALMRVMKDVLEVNRKILTELESKK